MQKQLHGNVFVTFSTPKSIKMFLRQCTLRYSWSAKFPHVSGLETISQYPYMYKQDNFNLK